MPPPRSWIKLNFDGAVSNNGLAGLGYIVRDDQGELIIVGSAKHFSHAVTKTEMIAANMGLINASSLAKHYIGIYVEGDNLEAINGIKAILLGGADGETQKSIGYNLSKFNSVYFNHISREANRTADILSKYGLENDCTLVRGMPLPSELLAQIRLDWDVF